MTWRSTVVALALVAAGVERSSITPALAQPANPSPHEQLRRDLGAIFSGAAVDHGMWAATIHSLRHGETLYSLNSFRLQTPASVQKLLTTAVAAERLGWDYRYTTRIYATGPIDISGAVNGDLIVVSDGDPTINPRHPERWSIFDEWGKQLAAKGVRRVNGYLIGDDNAFAEPGWARGWSWDDLAFGYGATVGALQYSENQVELLVGPGIDVGSRGVITVSPAGSGLIIDHQVTTVSPDQPGRLNLLRSPNSQLLSVVGQVPIGSPPITEFAAVDNPTQVYLNAMRVAFGRQGLNVERTPLDIDDVRLRPDMSKATLLLEDKSPPLAEIVDVALKWSRNIYAETLLLSIAPEGEPKSWSGGLAALEETLRSWSIFPDYFLARDGSGLSRYDYLSTDALTWLLTYVWMDPKHADMYRAALPLFGVNGTVANRLKDTPASGRVWAKTGSMSQVRSLAGYVVTSEGEPLVFSFIVNGFRVPQREIDSAMDRALLRLIDFKHSSHQP
ncbi:MAG TPA: D-alanyl-D-alanine carboxypeptidase/D-alanyl-D-alanine-endopeptidase [Vicinamibacterales bacterium]|nr:D-alanyl-D-alanine carboxypeptidase/D-alanyl-D-alanine-endopeptidase [Vicinamibacterales bacterium]